MALNPGFNKIGQHHYVVLGGGLQGSCIALELASLGEHVVLIEQDNRLLNRASLRNEGKIHLGLVYANDPSMETAKLQLAGALSFGKLLQKWTHCRIKDLGISTRFDYLVENDSLLNISELHQHYQKLDALYHSWLKEFNELDYLGNQPECLAHLMSNQEISEQYNGDFFKSGFATAEVAINTDRLSEIINDAVAASDQIEVLFNAKVEHISKQHGNFQIHCRQPNQDMHITSKQLINATWENRLKIDANYGIPIDPGWVHRLKYRVIVDLPARYRNARSSTMVIGRYGDIVVRQDDSVYLSWYPEAMRGWSHALSPPEAWQDACSGIVPREEAENIANEVRDALALRCPMLTEAQTRLVDAGTIFAHGQSDVDSKESDLHFRTKVGIKSYANYHTVNPGKLTTAPLIAMAAVRQIVKKFNSGTPSIEYLLNKFTWQ